MSEGKVQLLNDKKCDWYTQFTTPIKSALPFFEREGHGYVHRIRSAHLHRCPTTGKNKHTSFNFWCGQTGFLYPKGQKPYRKIPASLVAAPTPGRVVCAICQGKAVGAGQTGKWKIGDEFVKFMPRSDFFPLPRPI